MALGLKHISSCATDTAHYHVPQNGHVFSTYRLLSRLSFKHDPSFSLNIFYSINTNDIQHTYIVNIQRIRTKA